METEKSFNAFTISVTGYYQEWNAKQIDAAKKALLLALTGKDEADGYWVQVSVERVEF